MVAEKQTRVPGGLLKLTIIHVVIVSIFNL